MNIAIDFEIKGSRYEILTQGVNISDNQTHVKGINQGGELRINKHQDRQQTSLVLQSDQQGKLRYQYLLANQLIDDQSAAEQFISESLQLILADKQIFTELIRQNVTNALSNKVGHVQMQQKAIEEIMTQTPAFL